MNVNTFTYLQQSVGYEIVTIPIVYPLDSDDAFITPVIEMIKKYGSRIKLASFDHINSFPTTIVPVKRLTQLCHENNTIVFIDGAHAMGQIDVHNNT